MAKMRSLTIQLVKHWPAMLGRRGVDAAGGPRVQGQRPQLRDLHRRRTLNAIRGPNGQRPPWLVRHLPDQHPPVRVAGRELRRMSAAANSERPERHFGIGVVQTIGPESPLRNECDKPMALPTARQRAARFFAYRRTFGVSFATNWRAERSRSACGCTPE